MCARRDMQAIAYGLNGRIKNKMEKVRIGIVGLGRLGMRHAENVMFKIPNAELVAACSIKKEEVEYVRDHWGVPEVYTDFDEFIQNDNMDAVLIVSPSGQHCEQIVKALDRGFHVFSEKPLGIDVAQCKQAEKAVEKYPDQLFMLGFMRRFDPSYAQAKAMIREGRIGKPIMVKVTSMDPESQIDGFLPFAPTSGGIFRDLTVHDIDLVRWFLESDVTKITAAGGCYIHDVLADYGDVDCACALMEFENGTMAIFNSSRIAPHGSHIETEIVGTEGILRISVVPEKNRILIYDQEGVIQECTKDFLERWKEAFINEMQEFVNCIYEKRRPEVTVYDGTKCTEVSYAAMEALHRKETVLL